MVVDNESPPLIRASLDDVKTEVSSLGRGRRAERVQTHARTVLEPYNTSQIRRFPPETMGSAEQPAPRPGRRW